VSKGNHVVELVKEPVTNPHHHRFFAIVHGTLALIDAKKAITQDGTTRWRVEVNPEERCPMRPFWIDSQQITPRAVAQEAAEEFMERMRGKQIDAPSRETDEPLVHG
jgi:hypothetical protein